MKTNIFFPLVACVVLFAACDLEPIPLELQQPYTYDEQYYVNLRAYKKSDHQIFYGWYAAYAHLEGVDAEYKQSASWGEHIAGIPDSADIVSLWMGIPSLKTDDPYSTYNPIAYNEMQLVREKKGTKFVVPEITRIAKYPDFPQNEEGIIMYADHLLSLVFDNDLDGLDLDYEPEGDWIGGAQNTRFLTMVEYLGQFLGPQSSNPEKLLIIDYYNQPPHQDVEPYINYLIRQAYSQGFTEHNATRLQNNYNQVSWCPPHKFIVTENLGDWWQNAGSPFTEIDGNTISPIDGQPMYSLEGMARWNPIQGNKGGFGAFYFDRDYRNNPPYYNIRKAIQAANPAVR